MFNEGHSLETQLEQELKEDKKLLREFLFDLLTNKKEKRILHKENTELKKENDYLRNIIDALKRQGIMPMLSEADITQLALNSFWAKSRDNQEIGKLYEQYVGYTYENKGWEVDYFGINNGYDDLGRDLICKKDNIALLIQCKKWSQTVQIPIVHIFQLFGSMCEYRLSLREKKQNKKIQKVQGAFYTTTLLSNDARSFAKKVGIKTYEKFQLKKVFPIIKAVFNQKKYYLPTDNEYDSIKLDLSKGDQYFDKTITAENAGFHR